MLLAQGRAEAGETGSMCRAAAFPARADGAKSVFADVNPNANAVSKQHAHVFKAHTNLLVPQLPKLRDSARELRQVGCPIGTLAYLNQR